VSLVADIVRVEAPSSANIGDTVIVDVSVKNLGLAPGGYNYAAVTGVFDSSSLSWQFDYLYVAPQETVVFRGWFTMPSKTVTVTVSSWYWDGSQWVKDEEQSVSIALTELVSQVSELAVASFSKV
jgi:hypothetical protein